MGILLPWGSSGNPFVDDIAPKKLDFIGFAHLNTFEGFLIEEYAECSGLTTNNLILSLIKLFLAATLV